MTTTRSIASDGADLHVRVQGRGAALLVLQGGDGIAEGTDPLVRELTAHFTVITYDRRGLGRSPVRGAADDHDLSTHGEDASRVLAAVTDQPAAVVGFSIGGLIALDLLARHPEQVRVLVSHEPPAMALLRGAASEEAVAELTDIITTHREAGAAVAAPKLMGLAGITPSSPPSEPDAARLANLDFFIGEDMPAVLRHEPNLAALKGKPLVIGLGRDTGDITASRCARALAAELGAPTADFPGGHSGFLFHPQEFAARLLTVL
ncbi:alpha/beta fold hydrolase [Allokutzneria sp. NRRL B-24872]|uniref:alpha/beta fold hydrolase n=1 Tax=Allokutzneria sp. NRRL B-24872 TaxID=1137961 RepID=UPI000A3CF7D2|nr:alpha/beta fold hydrolase [Allokutzneria sp. NRRL B-24872]